MEGQVMCEVPMDQSACGDYCDPCHVPPEFTQCPQSGCNNCPCDCGDYSSCCYQQPPRTQPIRPNPSLLRSNEPMETDTIYKRSYIQNCGAECYRAKPIRPCNNIRSVKEPLEKCTVQKLSYMPHCNVARCQAIRPKENGLKFQGPIYAVSSQKHDFVPKGFCRRQPIRPRPGIWKPCDPLEKCTVNKLSYMPVDVCQHPPPKPIVQTYNYVRPTGPGEQCTVQKLSYLPLCIPPKEPMPWAEKVRCVPPKYENLCTTYNLSYIPNCQITRMAPILPISGLKALGTETNDNGTVYKLSYIGPDGRCCRPAPILPINGLEMPKGPMERCTVQKLSYQPNCCGERTAPIRPKENCIKPSGPMYFMTTQKHDFVSKPSTRRSPIKPMAAIGRAIGSVEKCTINKLSYMPLNVCEHRRPAPILPRPGVGHAEGPMEKCTTYKLSYIPNCLPPKQPLPWANASNYIKPTAPIEKCTIQKLSYRPPGIFSRCGGCAHQNGNQTTAYPKAGICN
ncbi:stabilizer of axonemal microtubules 1 [Musca domestica]|uniref:Stabilizer of axonemal microtubules 1 n=1 Tax=Musca domestica TaxID=7370 RepID=A0A1I8MRZ6_MUSDO|nr:stabilizer of axonemal microtubules 1 [Musca domestica]